MKQKIFLLLLFIITSSFAQNKNKTIGFKENKGQIINQKGKPNNAVKYLLNSGGLNVQLKKNGFSYDIYEVKKHSIDHSHNEKSKPLPFPSKDNDKLPDYTLEYQFHRIDIDFLNSNPKVELVTEEKSLDYDNYYNIPNKPEGILMAHQYKQITYKNIYPNIDVVFTVPKDTLKTVEYNFVVHPKGKISDIQLKFSGAQTELVNNKIRMNVRFGELEETLPMSWTEDGELKKEIAVSYTKIKKNIYGFESTENVSDKTVVIDPVPIRLWGTYYGGIFLNDRPNSINFDHLGNTIITGLTESPNGIATTGSFQSDLTNLPGSGFMAKLDSNGVRIWGTYLLRAGIQSAKINSLNQIYIGGYAYSGLLLSTPNSFKEIGDTGDGLLMKFDSNGQRIWGTYYGGQNFERIDAISLDSQENIIIAGETHSYEGIATPDGYQSTLNSSPDNYTGFFAKFDKDGDRLYGSYFPNVIIYSTIDTNNNAIFAGNQYIIDNYHPNISTIGAFKTNLNSTDGFIVKFSPNFTKLWCTYYGGDKSIQDSSENSDLINGIGNDDLNNIYVVGTTTSTNNISTTGASKISQNTGAHDAFIVKFNPNGNRQWGTYFGNTSTLLSGSGTNCFITKEGNIYLIGYTDSSNNISTPNSFQSTINWGSDGYIAKFSTIGELKWSTYYGGRGSDFLKSIDYQNGKIVVSGRTLYDDSTDLSTPGAYKAKGNRFVDIFIAEFQDCLSTPLASSNSPICIGNSLELKASGGTNYLWTGPNGFTSTDQNPTIINTTANNNGEYSCLITGTGGCDDTKKINVIIGDIETPLPNISNLPTITGDCHTLITTIPTATDACAGTITATTTNQLSYNLPGTYTVVWDYDDGNNNISHQNQTVIISNQPLPTATSPQTFCIQQNATLNDIAIITGQNIKWHDQLTLGMLLSNTIPLQNGNTYYASQTINGCKSERTTVLINIQNTIAPTGSIKQSFCTGQNPTLKIIEVVGTTIKWYDSPTQGNLLADTTPLVDGKTYYATQTVNNCESTNRLAITVSLISSLPVNDYDLSICDDLNDGTENAKLEDFNTYLISNTTNYNFSYYKSLPDAENQIISNKITAVSNYKLALGENKIYVRINSNTPCYAIATLKLTLLSKPFIPIQDLVPICENKSILIDAGSGADNYLWSNEATTQTITVDNPGNLSVTVTKNHSTISCSSDKSFTVKTSNIAKISSIETKDWTDNNNTITIFVTGLGDYEYSIDGTNYQANNLFSGVNSGEYKIYVRDRNGCGTATEEVYLLMYPKFFTPNGDGYNDTWKIKSSDNEKNLTLKIFDRFGKLLKELDSNSSGWDGTYVGQPLPATDYWFVVTRKNGTEHKGHFSLKR